MNGNNNQFFNTQNQNNYFPQNNNMPNQINNAANNMVNPNYQYNQVGQNGMNGMYNQPVQNPSVNNQQEMMSNQYQQEMMSNQYQQAPSQTVVTQQVPMQNMEQPVDNSFVMATVPKDSLKQNQNIPNAAVQSITNDNAPAKLDPLNNASNPIPINPVAPAEAPTVEAKSVTPFDIIKTIFDTIKNPERLLKETIPKFSNTINSIMFTAYLTGFSVILMIIMRIVVGGFVKNPDITTGSYTISYDFANIANQKFLQYILIALLVSGIAILVVGIIYYASSFINSKGMTLGKCIMISNVSFIPMILGFIIGYPLGGIISGYLAILLLGASVAYTLILFITGMNMYIESDTINTKIFYNLINFAFIIVIFLLIIYLFYSGTPIGIAIGIGSVG